MSNLHVMDVLAGARYSAPASGVKKTVLVAGAATRLGERVLTRLLGASECQQVYVLATNAVASTEIKLTAVTQSTWSQRVDHVIAVVGEPAGAGALTRRARTEVFSPLTVDDVLPLARQAKSLGITRFMLVTPTDVLSQPSAIRAQLSSLMESDLHQVGFESLVLVRPSDHEFRHRTGGIAQRLIGMIVNTATGMMAGLRHVPLSLEDTARGVVRAMFDSAHGLHIIETERLHSISRF